MAIVREVALRAVEVELSDSIGSVGQGVAVYPKAVAIVLEVALRAVEGQQDQPHQRCSYVPGRSSPHRHRQHVPRSQPGDPWNG
jgi:hypothetical protein